MSKKNKYPKKRHQFKRKIRSKSFKIKNKCIFATIEFHIN